MGARARKVCPICARDVAPRDASSRDATPPNPAFPFCSPTCKLVDLGRWLDGGYRVAVPDEGEAEGAPRPEGDGGSE